MAKKNTYIRKSTGLGGLIPITNHMNDWKLPELIRSQFNKRKAQAKFGYEDVILGHVLSNFCGGKKIVHIAKLQKAFSLITGYKIASHDTQGRVMKSLATESVNKRGKGHNKWITYNQTNENLKLNDLAIKITKRIGELNEQEDYLLDMDATFIPSESYEAKKSYHQQMGYYPMVACINSLVVYTSMRNGNVSPSAEIKGCLQNAIGLLKANNIKVGKVRMDSASYNVGALEYLNSENMKFYVGVVRSKSLLSKIDEFSIWNPAHIKTSTENWDCESADMRYSLTKDTNEYRLVILRTPAKGRKRPTKWVWGKGYSYKMVLTNDFESSVEDIIELYNQRGTSELNFHNLKVHHGWKYLPFSFMNQNTVYLILSAIANNIYQGVLNSFKKRLPEKKIKNIRLTKFIEMFVIVYCELRRGIPYFDDIGIDFKKLM